MSNRDRAKELYNKLPHNMTNEEKAREIANSYSSDVLQTGAYFGAAKMAGWKDQQFKEYLEKLKDEYDKQYSEEISNDDNYIVGKVYGRLCMVIEIINEFFNNE